MVTGKPLPPLRRGWNVRSCSLSLSSVASRTSAERPHACRFVNALKSSIHHAHTVLRLCESIGQRLCPGKLLATLCLTGP